MKNSYIAVLDSGIGGMSVLERLVKVLPDKRFLYFGDNKNAPYGNKSEDELLYLTLKNINYILNYNVNVIVFACNTISVKILPSLPCFINQNNNLRFYGTCPPVELAIKKLKEKTVMLCTCATEKAYQNINNSNLRIIGFSNLVKEIEQNKFNLEKVNFAKHLYIECKKRGLNIKEIVKADNLILGCTHFHFIEKQIIDHFQPKNIYDGGDFVAKTLLKDMKVSHTSKIISKKQVIFIGENKIDNKKFFSKWLKKQKNS